MKTCIKVLISSILFFIIVYCTLAILHQTKCINLSKIWYPKLYKHNFKEEYTDEFTKDKKIVFVAIVRNVSKMLPRNMDFLIHIGQKYFKDYHFVLFENDSDDNTRQIIKNFIVAHPGKITLLNCCNEGDCECKLKQKNLYSYGAHSNARIVKMSHYRNKYLNFVKNNFQKYDYMMVIDMDIVGTMPIKGFIDNFKIKGDWDAIYANGLNSQSVPSLGIHHITYDDFAFEPYRKKYKKNKTGSADIYKFQIQSVKKAKKEKKLLRVNSAFNGAGIYKIASILKYNPSYSNEMECEHRGLNKSFKKVFINPSWTLYVGIQGPDSLKFLLKDFSHLFSKRKVL